MRRANNITLKHAVVAGLLETQISQPRGAVAPGTKHVQQFNFNKEAPRPCYKSDCKGHLFSKVVLQWQKQDDIHFARDPR
jgi:hypothetical protein